MRRLVVALLLIAVACGPAQARPVTSPLAAATTTPGAAATAAPSPSPIARPSATPDSLPTPAPTPSTSSSLLFAALEAKGATTSKVPQWNTVAIVGLDGYAKAKTTFAPMPVPNAGCMGTPVVPVSAQVAAGVVYFADSTGVVRTLSAQGQITQVATFPLTSGQQMLSFAVSPDGSRLLGAVFTLPPNPQTVCTGSPSVGEYSLDVYAAQPGGARTLLYHESLAAHLAENRIDLGIHVMVLVGWDQVGPIATYPSDWVYQGGPVPNYRGTPVRVDSSSGKVLKQVSDPASCYVQDTSSSGNFACSLGVNGDLSVRRPDGSEIWHVASEPKNDYVSAYLSPDDRRLVTQHASTGIWETASQDGSRVGVARDFWPVDWLEPGTLIGVHGGGNLGFVGLISPGTIVDLGFPGQFVGTVHT
jgi:hypothetical protein